MKIEKKKVARNKPLPSAAKNAIVGLLGMTAVISLGACENGSSADSDEEPLGGDVFIPPNNQKNPQSSSETATQTSSSSQIVDIPLSHEPLSSSAIEALSSVAQISSSSTIKTTSSAEKLSPEYSSSYISSGVSSAMHPIRSSSSAADSTTSAQQSSSSQADSTEPSSSDAQTNSSNSIAQPSSSASHPVPPSVDCQMDSTGLRVIMCHDDGRGIIASMVSTYDMSEIM